MDEKYKFWQHLMPYSLSKSLMGLSRLIGTNKNINLKNLNRSISTGSEPQSVYLLDRDRQKQYMLQNGYTVDNTNNYALVKKAVGNRRLPIYQTPGLSADANNMDVIGNIDNWLATSGGIKHGAHYPTAIYYNNKDHYFYQRGWDLNDYGKDENKKSQSSYSNYNNLKAAAANILDFVGNPMVISTGYRKTPIHINNITLEENDISGKIKNYNLPSDIVEIQQQFNTYLKEHKGSSMIDPYDNFDNIAIYNHLYNIDNAKYYDYILDKNGNIIYNDNGTPKLNYNKRKKDIPKYMIVNTTKVPEVVAKRKRKCLGGIY